MRSTAQSFSGDAWNRLVQVKSGSTVVESYVYDGQNWRVRKTTGSTVRDFYYTQWWQVAYTVGGSPAPLRNIWGIMGVNNLLLTSGDFPGSALFTLWDYASVRTLVGYSGGGGIWDVVERYGYDAFGTPLFMNASFSPISGSGYNWGLMLYDNYPWDSATGFYQVRNRYLHPTLGRWLTRDPIGYGGGINLYAYVGNNSVNVVDSWGLFGEINQSYSFSFETEGGEITLSIAINAETSNENGKTCIKGGASISGSVALPFEKRLDKWLFKYTGYHAAIDISIDGGGALNSCCNGCLEGAEVCGDVTAEAQIYKGAKGYREKGKYTANRNGIGALATGSVCFNLCTGELDIGITASAFLNISIGSRSIDINFSSPPFQTVIQTGKKPLANYCCNNPIKIPSPRG